MSEVELDEELFSVCIPFRPEFVGSFLHFTTRNLVVVCVCVCVCGVYVSNCSKLFYS